MIEESNEQWPIIELTKSAAALERILPFCYPARVAPWKLQQPTADFELFDALIMYELCALNAHLALT